MNSLRFSRILRFSIFFFLLSVSSKAERKITDEVELIKKADNFFSQKKYSDALPHYSRLLSVNPEKTKYIYRFGVCLLMAGKEKTNAATFLYLAAKDSLAPPDVFYFLGRGYLLNNEFIKAQKAFETFKKKEKPNHIKNYDLDAYLRNCENGIHLSSQRKNVIIIGINQLPEEDFYKNFDFSGSAGRIVKAADEFLSSLDKKRQKDPVMFVSNDRNTVYIPTYGTKGENGKDIYVARKAANNSWTAMENLGSTINSPADEDFPFLDLDGKTLYFSSNGSKSIGGYDIFKSEYNSEKHQWSEPENLGVPINTSGDDFLFVPGPDGRTASYSTTEESEKNTVSIRKIKLPSGYNQTMVTITGVFLPLDQKVRRDARITILTSNGDGIITSVHTDPKTGSYRVVVPSGDTYTILVEGGGYVPHAELFEIPSDLSTNDLKQVVKLDKQNLQERLILQNYFSSGITATVPTNTFTRTYPAKLDSLSLVNINIEGKSVFATAPLKDMKSGSVALSSEDVKTSDQTDSVASGTSKAAYLPQIKIKRKDKFDPTMESGPSASILHQQEEENARKDEIKEEENSPDVIFNANISNKELSEIVYEDAVTLETEADSLYREAGIIRKLAAEKEDLSKTFLVQAEEPGLPADSSKALIESSENNAAEAAELYSQAEQLKMLASELANEAIQSVAEANEMFQNDNANGALASTGSGIKYTSKYSKADVVAMREEPVKSVDQADNVQQSAVAGKQDPIHSESEPVVAHEASVKQNIVAAESNTVGKSQASEIRETEQLANNTGKTNDGIPEKLSADKQETKVTGKENALAVNTPEVDKKQFTPESSNNINKESVVSKAGKDVNVPSQSEAIEPAKPVAVQASESVTSTPSVQVNTNGKEQIQEVTVNSVAENATTSTNKPNPVVTKSASTEKPAITSKGQSGIVEKEESLPNIKMTKDENVAAISTDKIPHTINAQQDLSLVPEPAKNPVNEKKTSNDVTAKAGIKDTQIKKDISEPVIADKQKTTEEKPEIEHKSDLKNQTVNSSESVEKLAIHSGLTNPQDQKTASNTTLQDNRPGQMQVDNGKNSVAHNDSKKLLKGEEPRNENSSDHYQEDVALVQHVNQDALLAYREYQKKMQRSNELTAKSLQIQTQLDKNPYSPDRDSLVRASNDMSLQSIREWQDAQQKIKVARSIEPGIDYKMSVNDFSASTQLSNGKNTNTGAQALASEKTSEKKEPAGEVSSSVSETNGGNWTNAKTLSGNNVTSGFNSAALSSSDTGENEKEIDTTHSEYPTYVKLKEEIGKKQEQTISEFAVAMNLNKKASEEKDLENSLRDKAQVTSDPKKKAEMLKEADDLKKKSEQYEKESIEKFSLTKEKINNVKTLNSDLGMVKERISKTPEKETIPSGNATLASQKTEKLDEAKVNSASSNTVSANLAPVNSTSTNSSIKNERKVEELPEKRIQSPVNAPVTAKIENTATVKNEITSPISKQQNENVNQELKEKAEQEVADKKMEKVVSENNHSAVSATLPAQKTTEKVQLDNSKDTLTAVALKTKPAIVEKKSSGKNEMVSVSTSKSQESVKPTTNPDVAVNTKIQPKKLNSTTTANNPASDQSVNTTGKQSPAPVFAKANSVKNELSLSEEEIAAVSVSKKESDEVVKNIFSINGISSSSKVNEIPMDPQLPDGLVFKVQISAFRKPIAADNFNGIEPLTGESTRPGWVRYCVGMFKTFEPANVVKKEIRKIGYKDAFVVAYYNGKRIELNEAYRLIKGQENLTAYRSQSAKEMAILRSINIIPEKVQLTEDRDEMAFYGIPAASAVPAAVKQSQETTVNQTVSKNIRDEKGEYAVQVGVYSRSKAPEMLASVQDLRSEKINSGLFRFTSGKFPDYSSAEAARNKIREQGIRDAFIVLYREGKKEIASEKNSDIRSISTEAASKSEKGLTIKPSVITTELRYKVQIGAYKNDVPFDMIEAYIAINDKGISTQLDDRELHIFYAGDFSSYKEAESLRTEIISKGVKDAFVVAIQNGKRLAIQEGMK